MKASKFIVLVGGILGILAFFLPLASGKTSEGREVSISAFVVVKGIDAAKEVVKGDDVVMLEASLQGAEKAKFQQDKDDINKTLGDVKGIIIGIFVPALLLVVIGGLAVSRKKFGRLGGTGAFLLGAITLGIAAILKGALENEAGIGITLLLVTGAAGLIGGLLALIKPERGHVHA